MGKKISAKELKTQLGSFLDQLEQGQSHFVIERNDQEVAVLLSMEKFRDIMQMLELLNTLDFIDTGAAGLDQELLDGSEPEFPDLFLLRPSEDTPPNARDDERPAPAPRTRGRKDASIEDVAAKLGIRIIK